jgi:hypothetical protein
MPNDGLMAAHRRQHLCVQDKQLMSGQMPLLRTRRRSMIKAINTVVVVGGQAGPSVSYYLTEHAVELYPTAPQTLPHQADSAIAPTDSTPQQP